MDKLFWKIKKAPSLSQISTGLDLFLSKDNSVNSMLK